MHIRPIREWQIVACMLLVVPLLVVILLTTAQQPPLWNLDLLCQFSMSEEVLYQWGGRVDSAVVLVPWLWLCSKGWICCDFRVDNWDNGYYSLEYSGVSIKKVCSTYYGLRSYSFVAAARNYCCNRCTLTLSTRPQGLKIEEGGEPSVGT